MLLIQSICLSWDKAERGFAYGKQRKETAFYLQPGQYGRILWNERKTDCDTGEWYYQLHINNLLHCTEPKSDIFLTRQPDFVYKQLAVL